MSIIDLKLTFPTRTLFLSCLILISTLAAAAQGGKETYDRIKAFSLSGTTVNVHSLTLKRDRVDMTFNGTFYFTAPIDGRVTGAVFVGSGTFSAPVPPSQFEKANVKRLLGVDDKIESSFATAVLRFSDDSFERLTAYDAGSTGQVPSSAQALASETDRRILKEAGVNLAARVALSILDKESPGFFSANFDGGDRGRFSYLFDPQNRVPTASFELNAGERGIIFKYDSTLDDNEVWMAFYSLADYERRSASYSDQNDLINISTYDMNIDLRQPKKLMGLKTKISIQSKVSGLRAIPFSIGESLGKYDNERLKHQMRIKAAHLGTVALETAQEDWEGGFTVFLPNAMAAGDSFDLDLEIEGDFLHQPDSFGGNSYWSPINYSDCNYPISNSDWYPRHGYLNRSAFSFTYLHSKKQKVASSGTRISEEPDPSNKEMMITKYSMKFPVALATFALGPFERHPDSIKWDNGDKPTPLEFNSLSGDRVEIKEDFILAEMNNSVRYFQFLFGKYPYETFGGVFHPFRFGQGFATLLTIPGADKASKYTYSFLAHETAHQWWGNIVVWRSYRDQWLSEGFAEYSGILYTAVRDNKKSAGSLIDEERNALKDPPMTLTGPGKGKLVDVGPLILGHRLQTKKTFGAYTTLVYDKGALVLRMLNFLMTDPATGDGKPFFDMMRDFVERYRNKVASTDDFRIVANEHFAKTPIARKYGVYDLNWFFQQWVYRTELPSYKINYQVQDQPDGTAIVTGNVLQENAGPDWFMPLPVVFKFSGGRSAFGTVAAIGSSNPFTIKLPSRPEGIDLDPDRWVLSEKTTTR